MPYRLIKKEGAARRGELLREHSRAAAEVGDAGLSGQIVNEAEGLEGGLRAAGALPFQAGKIIADEVKIEFVNCFIFVTH